jgi:hypothetical protein
MKLAAREAPSNETFGVQQVRLAKEAPLCSFRFTTAK